MTDAQRFAVYVAPRPGTQPDTFGSMILGRDVDSGREVSAPAALAATFPQWRSLVAAAAHYGFHATLKPPFALADGVDRSRLTAEVAALARAYAPVPIGRMQIAQMGAFVALVPTAPPPALAAFAAAIVQTLDPLRAPLTAADRARRKPDSLTDRQRRYLDQWGYPYVLDEFRLHMTLSGPLQADQRARAAQLLGDLYAPFDGPVTIDDLCIFTQSHRESAFRLQARQPLIG